MQLVGDAGQRHCRRQVITRRRHGGTRLSPSAALLVPAHRTSLSGAGFIEAGRWLRVAGGRPRPTPPRAPPGRRRRRRTPPGLSTGLPHRRGSIPRGVRGTVRPLPEGRSPAVRRRRSHRPGVRGVRRLARCAPGRHRRGACRPAYAGAGQPLGQTQPGAARRHPTGHACQYERGRRTLVRQAGVYAVKPRSTDEAGSCGRSRHRECPCRCSNGASRRPDST